MNFVADKVSGWANSFWQTEKHPYQVLTGILAAFILGIFSAKYLDLNWQKIWLICFIIILALLLASLINLALGNKQLIIIGWFLLFLTIGLMIYSYQSQKYYCHADLSGGNIEVSGMIINNPVLDYNNQEIIIQSNFDKCQNVRLLAKIPHYPILNYGDRVSMTANLEKPGMIEDFDYAKYLRPQKVSYLAINPGTITIADKIPGVGWRLLRRLFTFKKNFETAVNQAVIEPEASLAVGLITGSKSNLSEELSDNLNTSGLTHIIALSGFNVTIIVAALASVLAGMFSRKKIFWIGSALVVAFIVMTGASSSVVRAGIFSLLVLYGKTLGRRAYQTNLLLLAAAVMLLFNPFLLIDDLGFQLSFLAFAGMIYLSDSVAYFFASSRLSVLPDWLKKALIETLAAQILVFPLIFFAFGRVSLISPLTNVTVLWILPLAMLLAFLIGIAGMISLYLGKIIALAAWPVLTYIITIANLGAKIPYAALATEKYNISITFIMYLAIFTVMIAARKRVNLWQKNMLKSS